MTCILLRIMSEKNPIIQQTRLLASILLRGIRLKTKPSQEEKHSKTRCYWNFSHLRERPCQRTPNLPFRLSDITPVWLFELVWTEKLHPVNFIVLESEVAFRIRCILTQWKVYFIFFTGGSQF